MKKKLVLCTQLPEKRKQEIEEYCDITIAGELKHGKGNVTEKMVREECKGYEIVVLGDETAKADTINTWVESGMKFIGVAKGTPVTVDNEAIKAAGLQLSYTPGRNRVAVAEFNIGLMIAVARKLTLSCTGLSRGEHTGDPVEDIYTEDNCPFEMDKATVLREGTDVALIACGEMVKPCYDAAKILEEEGISATVLDMYCVKPLDTEAVIKAAQNAKAVVTAEEHAPFGGLGSMVAQVVGANCPRKVINVALPDAPVITGTSKEVYDYYGMTAEGIAAKAREAIK